jgi:thiol:disulfide interchange protein DsbD
MMGLVWLLVVGLASAQPPSDEQRIKARGVLAVDQVHPGSSFQAAIIADVEKGWHVNAHTPTLDYLIPTELKLEPLNGFTFGEVKYPKALKRKFEFAEETLDVYEGRFVLPFSVTVTPGASLGEKVIKGTLGYQACNDQVCEAPASVDVSIVVKIVSPDQPSKPINADIFQSSGSIVSSDSGSGTTTAASENEIARLIQEKGWWLAFASIFVLGLALNLTPCVYPMIPITIGFFSNQSEGKTSRVFVLGLMYLLGIAITYSILGVVAALTGQMFGQWLQNPWVLVFIVAVMVALALSLFGVYQIQPPSFIMQKISGGSSAGMLGALVMGLVVGIVAAPCVGPVTIALLTYVGSTGNPWLGFWMFFTLSVGLGAPYVVLGMFSGGLKKLPRSGVWMIWVERLFGCALIGLAVYFLAPLLPDTIVPWLVLTLAAASGVYLGWLEKSAGGKTFYWVKKGVGVGAIALGVFFILPSPAVAWQQYDPAILERAKQAGKPVILDFTADWCVPCHELDRFTFSDSDVIEATKPFVTVKVDVTRSSPETDQLLKQLGIKGPPAVIFLDPQGRELKEARLIGYEGPDKFLQRVKQAL